MAQGARKAGGGLARPVQPSADLAAICGSAPLPRSQVVSKVWDHIRKNNLQNPQNKREILADDKLKKVFGGKDRVSMITRRLGLPYIVGLVIGGFLIALLPNSPELPLSRELIFNVLLPPLVFEAALQLNWQRFRDELALTLTLAFLGVAIAGTIVAAGMHYWVGWSWIGAALFGALIAATDPVSVIAAFREMRAEKRLSMVVESESLLNDGAAAAGFAVLLAIAGGSSAGPIASTMAFLWATGGGVLTGLAISSLAILIAGRTNDHLIEITLTTVVAYSSFLVAEHFHDERLVEAVAEEVDTQKPDLVVISGDFTQRARTEQFREACNFLEGLRDRGHEVLGVPGNHGGRT